ncbi:hypothetical protein GGR57DRAFT_502084 [Xylariaceae sp. FL1272]|nr:hypothetical protein GGR57DRAFT_502084 [Xylariaceae sp. FL1272]
MVGGPFNLTPELAAIVVGHLGSYYDFMNVLKVFDELVPENSQGNKQDDKQDDKQNDKQNDKQGYKKGYKRKGSREAVFKKGPKGVIYSHDSTAGTPRVYVQTMLQQALFCLDFDQPKDLECFKWIVDAYDYWEKKLNDDHEKKLNDDHEKERHDDHNIEQNEEERGKNTQKYSWPHGRYFSTPESSTKGFRFPLMDAAARGDVNAVILLTERTPVGVKFHSLRARVFQPTQFLPENHPLWRELGGFGEDDAANEDMKDTFLGHTECEHAYDDFLPCYTAADVALVMLRDECLKYMIENRFQFCRVTAVSTGEGNISSLLQRACERRLVKTVKHLLGTTSTHDVRTKVLERLIAPCPDPAGDYESISFNEKDQVYKVYNVILNGAADGWLWGDPEVERISGVNDFRLKNGKEPIPVELRRRSIHECLDLVHMLLTQGAQMDDATKRAFEDELAHVPPPPPGCEDDKKEKLRQIRQLLQ